MLSRIPLVGPYLMDLALAGETIGGATLSRFFALHVIIFPLLILGLITVHVYLALQNGVSEPPQSGRPVDRSRYREWYRRHKDEGDTLYFPDVAWREFVFVLVVYSMIFGLAAANGPNGPGPVPDPALLEAVPRPDWYFLWYYALIWYKPAALDELVLVWFPVLIFPVLMLLPLLFGEGERSPKRRPWALFVVLATFLIWTVLTGSGVRSDWIPDFETEPIPPSALAGAPPEVILGAALHHQRGCQYCHRALDRGGRYGPDLTASARELSRATMSVRIIQGIGNMPAYHGILSAQEVDAILDFLVWSGESGVSVPEVRR